MTGAAAGWFVQILAGVEWMVLHTGHGGGRGVFGWLLAVAVVGGIAAGVYLVVAGRDCPECGRSLGRGAEECPECGRRLASDRRD